MNRLSRLLLVFIVLLLAGPLHAAELRPLLFPASSNVGTKVDDKALQDFYGRRGYAPAWKLSPTNLARTVKDFSTFAEDTIREHGLNPDSYPLKRLAQLGNSDAPDALPKADIVASDIVLRLARSLAGQNPVPQNDPEHVWPIRRAKIDVAGELNQAIERRAVPAWLERISPHNADYIRLQQALKDYHATAAKGGWTRVPEPEFRLFVGASDPSVAKLYERLAQEDYLPFSPERYAQQTYDQGLVDAIKAFQEAHGLYADGEVGTETMRALNTPVRERIDQIRVNMARMRQSPPDAWEDIVINLPSQRLTLFKHGVPVYEAVTVVGRQDRPSPLVSSSIYEFIINPSWHVPDSIAAKDLFPQMRKDPNYLAKHDFVASTYTDASGKRHTTLRQKPGEQNSLGRLKFNFANRYSVYLHGTPHEELFGRDNRTNSSGCIRLKEPLELAAIVMKNDPNWSVDKIQQRVDNDKTITVPTPARLPIKLLYWTVKVDNQNRVQFYTDIYGIDKDWLAVL